MKKLSQKQIVSLVQVARKAYAVSLNAGLTDECFTAWRRRMQFIKTAHGSLTDCTQRDYVPLYNMFAALAGVTELIDHTWSDNAKVVHQLKFTMNENGFSREYLCKLATAKYRVLKGYGAEDILEAIEVKLGFEEIVNLLSTINNRARAKAQRRRGQDDSNKRS